jgi:hypothetical protein
LGERSNPLNQQLFRNIYLIELLIKLLQHDAKYINSQLKTYPATNELSIKHDFRVFIIMLCYKILGRLVYEVVENQELLNNHLQLFMQHLEILPSALIYNLLDPLVSNNVMLLMNTPIVH